MIQAAGLGVAFCAKPKLRESADLSLDVRDLRQLIGLLP
jgi:phosphoserine phosphatase